MAKVAKKIFITGVAGTGKSTIGNELSKKGFAVICLDSTPGLCSWVHTETKRAHTGEPSLCQEFLGTHEFICDIERLEEHVEKSPQEIVCIVGSAKNRIECIAYANISFLLHCSPEVFLSRIKSREDNLYGKKQDTVDFILKCHQTEHDAAVRAGAIEIDSNRPVAVIVDEIIRNMYI